MIQYTITTKDGTVFSPQDVKYIGHVAKVRDRDVNRSAPVVGRFPVFVERSGSYRLFTVSSKITSFDSFDDGVCVPPPLGVI